MDARTALWAGTGTAVVMAVAMSCGVALGSARALADRPGAALAGTAVVVHGNPTSTAAPRSSVDGRPETVSAPAPKDIGSSHDEAETDQSVYTPTTESARTESSRSDSSVAPSPTPSTNQTVPREAARTGARKPTSSATPAPSGAAKPDRTQSDRPGRSDQKLRELAETWKKRLAERTDRSLRHFDEWTSVNRTDEHSGSRHPRLRPGSQKEQSPRSPDNGD